MVTERAPLTVLVVDDEQDILDSLADFLESSLRNARIVKAAGGAEALQALAHKPDIVLTDYRMPRVDGLEVLRAARQAGVAATMMITAFPDAELAQRALNDGRIARFFVKPPDTKALVESIQAVIDDVRAGRSRQAAFDRAREVALKATPANAR